MDFGGTDDLVIFVAFAGEEDDISGFCLVEGRFDRGCAVGFDVDFGTKFGGKPGQDFLDNEIRVFRSGVIAGDENRVRVFFRDVGHSGPFGPVPIAAAAEDHDKLVGHEGFQGRKDIDQAVVGMGVIDEDFKSGLVGNPFKPAGDGGKGFNQLKKSGKVEPRRDFIEKYALEAKNLDV